MWLAAITRNPHHAPYFRRHFGADAYDAPLFAQFVGPWLLRPRPHIMHLVHVVQPSSSSSSSTTSFGQP
jgi:hypothetical protein